MDLDLAMDLAMDLDLDLDLAITMALAMAMAMAMAMALAITMDLDLDLALAMALAMALALAMADIMEQLSLFNELAVVKDRLQETLDRLGMDEDTRQWFEPFAVRYWTAEVLDKLELELWYMKGLI